MKSISKRQLREDKRGQGIVEFSLILPILLLMIFGIIEFGRLLFIYASVASASREAVRYGSAVDATSGLPRYADCAGIRAAAKRIGDFAGVQDAGIAIKYDDGTSDTVASCAGITDFSDIELGDRVVVSVIADYAPMVMFVNLPSFPIRSSSARTIVKRVSIEGVPPDEPPPLPNCGLVISDFSVSDNEAQWTITNHADSDVIRGIHILFHSSHGNLVSVKTRVVGTEDFYEIWGDIVGFGPEEATISSDDLLPVPPATDEHSVISNSVARDIKFIFESNTVVAAAEHYDLEISFENCGELVD